jgi:hypothetical protein
MRKIKHTKKLPDGRPTKYVRIDPRTVIEVSADANENEARSKYLKCHKIFNPLTRTYDRDKWILRPLFIFFLALTLSCEKKNSNPEICWDCLIVKTDGNKIEAPVCGDENVTKLYPSTDVVSITCTPRNYFHSTPVTK